MLKTKECLECQSLNTRIASTLMNPVREHGLRPIGSSLLEHRPLDILAQIDVNLAVHFWVDLGLDFDPCERSMKGIDFSSFLLYLAHKVVRKMIIVCYI